MKLRTLLIKLKMFDLLDIVLLRNTKTFYDLPARIKQDWRANTSYRELVNLYRFATAVSTVPGDFAELGVFRGGTAKLLAEADQSRTVHLFDTFTGIPEATAGVDGMGIGDCCCPLDAVRAYIGHQSRVAYHVGRFPDSTAELERLRFALVNLDADQYSTTLSALRWFWPRLSPGGVIVSHDYSTHCTSGINKAFDEWALESGATVLPIWDSQAVVCKPNKSVDHYGSPAADGG